MLPGLEKARQAELVEFLVFLVFSRKGGNKLIDINTKRTKITDFKKQVQDIWRFLVTLLISRNVFSSGGEARQRDGSLPSHGVSASHPQAAHVRGALVIPCHPIGIGST